ncbi:uncharacterized protein [Typha latifolia]|uniref:uncharacterized protein n=1 Tax=Typha latifolia TaxID=4733 RepID=UPI003C2F7D40
MEEAKVGGEDKKMMKILVAVDDSQGSLYALSWAIDHLLTIAGTATAAAAAAELGSLILLHAQQPLHHYMYPVGPEVYATSSVIESVKKAQEENSRNVLNKALHICQEKGIRAESIIVDGDPKDMICQTAEQMHVDLLIIGNRGLGTIKRAFLGSVSDYCAHHAKCATLIVKPPKATH